MTVKTDDKIDQTIWRAYLVEDHPTARTALDRLIAVCPDHWAGYALLVDVMLQAGQEADIPARLRTLEGRADLPAAMLALIGSGYEAFGDFAQAAVWADRALDLDAECARAWNLNGVLAYRRHDRAAAVPAFEKAAQCDAGWGEPWTNLGTIYWERQERTKALDCFAKGFGLSPVAPNVAAAFHIAVSETGQYDRARALFDEAVARHPEFRKGRFLLIDILIRLEAYPDALAQIEAVVVRFGADAQLLAAARAVRAKVGPLTIAAGPTPSLSLCMIVKNEEKYLPRCLASLKPLADEIVVVDTGSSDATRHIAEVFGARVFDYEWQDDFAAARNFSLAQATGDWILVMDADEVIAASDHPKMRNLLPRDKSRPCAFMIVTRNYTRHYNLVGWEPNTGQYAREEAGVGWIPSEKVRLFPNSSDIRFDYPVHEVVGPSLSRKRLPIASCPYPVHHYGKLDDRRERQKDEYYYQIGSAKLAASQNDPIAIREMAVQAAKLSRHEDALTLWRRLAEIEPHNARCHINMASNYGKLRRYADARASAMKAVEIDPKLKEGHLNLGLSELHLGAVAAAENIFRKIVKKHRNHYSAVFLLGASQLCQGKTKQGAQTLQAIKDHAIRGNLSFAVQELVASLIAAGQRDCSRNLISGAAGLNCSNDMIRDYGRQLGVKAA